MRNEYKTAWENARRQDINSAKECLARANYSAKHYPYSSRANHIEHLRQARLFIDSVRFCNKYIDKYK